MRLIGLEMNTRFSQASRIASASSWIAAWYMPSCGINRMTQSSPSYGKERNFSGEHFWARGCAVSTVGFDLEQVRQYIREQDAADGASGQF